MLTKWFSKRRAIAHDFRRQGDCARDVRDWSVAAQHYGSYLKYHPKDFEIWVQLGHMHKEAGSLDKAGVAYRRAARLKATDADLMLSFGHLSKMTGDIPAAARHYSDSLAAGGGTKAFIELSDDAISDHLDDDARNLLAREAKASAKALSPRCHGLTPIDSSNVMQDDQAGIFHLRNNAWIEYELDAASPKAGAAELSIDATMLDESDFIYSQVYVDYGSGYSDDTVINFDGSAETIRLIVLAPDRIRSLRWHPAHHGGAIAVDRVSYRMIETTDEVLSLVERNIVNTDDAPLILGAVEEYLALEDPDLVTTLHVQELVPPRLGPQNDYRAWVKKYITPWGGDYARIAEIDRNLDFRPKFSFVVPVYKPPIDMLIQCLDSMLAQTYADFEICLADDNSADPAVTEILAHYAEKDRRVRYVVREKNGHISAASNSALALATGDFIVLVDNDDLIPDYTLVTVAYYINKFPASKILYSDEDKIDMDGVRSSPYFKSSWNRFLMYGHNMISHLGVYDRDVIEKIGGFRQGLEGSQDYDLFLRAYEIVGDDAVTHIPHVLYHWRMIPGSTAVSAGEKSYAIVAAENSINGHFERTVTPLRSWEGFCAGLTSIRATREYQTPISIIIPTKDGLDVLKPCIESILSAPHDNIEIIVVDNGSKEPETLDYLADLAAQGEARILAYPDPFNFAEINNFAAEHATGELLCFLNNDTEVRTARWLDRARMLLALPEIGMVGARLLFPDDTVQHFGIGLGIGRHKVAGTPHALLGETDPGYFGKARLVQEVSAVTAACMFVRRSEFLESGGFDPAFVVAYNDVDLCMRYRQAGFKIVVDPDITLTHRESKSRGSDDTGAKAIRLAAEAQMMRDRWAHQLDNDPFISPNISLERTDNTLATPPRVAVPWREPVSRAIKPARAPD